MVVEEEVDKVLELAAVVVVIIASGVVLGRGHEGK